MPPSTSGLKSKLSEDRAIAQAVSRWLPTAAVRGSKPDLGMWDLWWDKVALSRFSPSTLVSPAIVVRSTNYSTISLIYHPGKMYNRPMCGRSTGTYKNLGDLQRDLSGLSPTPPKKSQAKTSMKQAASGVNIWLNRRFLVLSLVWSFLQGQLLEREVHYLPRFSVPEGLLARHKRAVISIHQFWLFLCIQISSATATSLK
jgi:hypothetical protein